MSQGGGGKLMPNLDHHSTKILNLTVLQRIDPFVEEILITAAHVTFYEFNIDASPWSRKDVEGSLFVVKRNTQPRFQFIVMNGRSTDALNFADNLVENLLEDFEFEVQVPYLLYRNAAQEVNGIWFYNSRECAEVDSLFTRILNAYSKILQKSKASSTKSEFEELESVPTMAVMDVPLEPPSSTPANVSDVPDDLTFVNFFSSSLNVGIAPNATVAGQPYQPPVTVAPPPDPAPVISTIVPPLQMTSSPLTTPTPPVPFIDTNEANSNANRAINEVNSNANRATNLVKPSFFIPTTSAAPIVPPVSSSIPTVPLLHPPVLLQRPYGAPILQPFPPPAPPPSLTPVSVHQANYGPVINREKVREALLALVQDNRFIDMAYRTLLNAHNS